MSKPGRPCGIFQVKVPRFLGKKNVKIEFFHAAEWQRRYRPYKKNTYPKPPCVDREGLYWSKRYRLRVDGRWHGVADKKFTFYTLPEALQLVEDRFKEITGCAS